MRIHIGRLTLAAVFVFMASPVFATPVTLNAVDRPGGPILNEPVEWQVLKLDKNGKPVPTPLAVGSQPVLKTDLKPGRYQIVAIRGTVTIKQGLVIGSGNEVRNIVVSAANAAVNPLPTSASAATATGAPATGTAKPTVPAAIAQASPGPATTPAVAALIANAKLKIGMIPNSGRGFISEPIDWQVFTYTKGATENGQMVAEKNISSASFNLPAGSYVIRALYKGTQSDLVIPLSPGQSYDYTINLYAGEAKLVALRPTGPAKQNVSWQVVRAKPGPDGKYALVTASSDASPQLLIREGNYIVIAKMGDAWGMQPLAVKAGRITTAQVKLQSGGAAPLEVALN